MATLHASSLPLKVPLKARSSAHSRSSSSASATPSSSTPSTTLITLRALYQRAVRAFLKRDTTEAQSHIDVAFQLLTPPTSAQPDVLSSQRKKWDILRITLETTLYASSAGSLPSHDGSTTYDVPRTPSPSPSSSSYNRASNLLLSPPSLLATLHTRSLCLFTPISQAQQPSPAFLPPQILVSLVLASLKLNCPQVGRGMVEEWLARRPIPLPGSNVNGHTINGKGIGEDTDDAGYAKVIDVYCLHVLPRLADWEYGMEFLKYEVDLHPDERSRISESLKALHHLHLLAQEHQTQSHASSDRSSSSSSPTMVSSGLSLSDNDKLSRSSSTSSFTAVPGTPKPHMTNGTSKYAMTNGHTTHDESEGDGSRPSSRASTIKYSALNRENDLPPPISAANGKGKERMMASSKPTTNLYHVVNASTSSSSSSATNATLNDHGATSPTTPTPSSSSISPNLTLNASETFTRYLALLRYQMSPYLAELKSRLPFIVCVVLPLMAFLARWRHRTRRGSSDVAGKGTVEDVRRKLGVELSGQGGGYGVWRRVYKMLEDTVVMAGRGLTAKEALENARKQLPFEVDTVNIYDQGQERWKRRYVYEIPVLMLGDEIKAKGRWGESEVLKALQEFRQKQEEEGERKA
ncbi:hypothetical protein FRB96_009247 [Tulasnella sp. 330]|nr:hypothetical protein FRB96_009247 [Tulasnella sp. 330]KAG8883513.1 hypothetical protein FRB97_006496 [Tulasnella sp. 331]KAG8889420.1 hypothetical protein FRB98_004316 [Tulasnella sp. 332]